MKAIQITVLPGEGISGSVKMTQKDNILQELNELKSSLVNVTRENIYTVPVGYFDVLAAQVISRIKAMEAVNAVEELGYLSPMLGNISKEMPYAVPAGYFEEIAEKALQTVHTNNHVQSAKEELATLSTLLSGLNKKMPYAVPQGYFETLSTGLPASPVEAVAEALGSHIQQNLVKNETRKETRPVAKIISITSRKWFRYAAAAAITGIIFLAGFSYFSNEKVPGGKALAKFTRDIKKLDDTQKDNLINFIDAGMNGDETAQINTDNKKEEVKNLLQGVSAEELKDFEEQTEDIQDVLMAN